MEQDTDRVVFRMIQGQVEAFLPDTDVNWGRISVLGMIGGHSEGSLGYYRKGRLATPEEYADLKQYMEGYYGYKLRVMKRIKHDSINWVK
jgi:hypothetical protein